MSVGLDGVLALLRAWRDEETVVRAEAAVGVARFTMRGCIIGAEPEIVELVAADASCSIAFNISAAVRFEFLSPGSRVDEAGRVLRGGIVAFMSLSDPKDWVSVIELVSPDPQ